jgi:hypothetical protein
VGVGVSACAATDAPTAIATAAAPAAITPAVFRFTEVMSASTRARTGAVPVVPANTTSSRRTCALTCDFL